MAVEVPDREAVERRFISEGIPTLIYGYSFRCHVLPRALSFMVAFGLAVLVFALSLYGSEFLLLTVLAVVMWWGLRRARQARRPLVARTATTLMLVAWFAWPVVMPVLVAFTQPPVALSAILWGREAKEWSKSVYNPEPELRPTAHDMRIETGKAILFLFVVWLIVGAIAVAVTWVGGMRLVGRALRDVVGQVSDVLYIQSRTLPAMVFLTLFLFVNADMWQASDSLTRARLVGALTLFAGVAFLATWAQLREERDKLVRQSGAAVDEARGGLGDVGSDAQAPGLPPLTRTQQFNIVLAFGARQIAQSVWVGIGVFAFLFALGMTVVPAKTAARWMGNNYQKLLGLPIPVALVHAAVLLAGFAAMYFAVTSMTDPAYRERFFAPTAQKLQEVLRIHAAYAERVGVPDTGPEMRTVAHRVAEAFLAALRELVATVRGIPDGLGRAVRRRGQAHSDDAPAGSAEDGESGG